MPIAVNTSVRSPNFSLERIDPKFIVLHYTACDLAKTLEIFSNPATQVCSHFVIAENGEIYDLGDFLASRYYRRGAHAGQSRWQDGSQVFEGFNQFSIGVELVNRNGNAFDYSPAQLDALVELTKDLGRQWAALRQAKRVVGHENIAGFRGKCDPGRRFPWAQFFERAFPGQTAPRRESRMSADFQAELLDYLSQVSDAEKSQADFWTRLSTELEVTLASR